MLVSFRECQLIMIWYKVIFRGSYFSVNGGEDKEERNQIEFGLKKSGVNFLGSKFDF